MLVLAPPGLRWGGKCCCVVKVATACCSSCPCCMYCVLCSAHALALCVCFALQLQKKIARTQTTKLWFEK